MFPPKFKPMLADPVDFNLLKYPLLVSGKCDGYRCLVSNSVAYSRNLKEIRNKYVQEKIRELNGLLDGHDGEIVVGELTAKDVFRKTSSGVSSFEGEPDFRIHVFDRWDLPHLPYIQRLQEIDTKYLLPHYTVHSFEELMEKEQEFTSQGFEGLMIRSVNGPYKYGRSTAREGYLLKVKRFLDDEAPIIGFYEEEKNNNLATVDNLGRTKRSAHKENMIPKDTLGGVTVRLSSGLTLDIGSGFTHALRKEIWENQDKYLGKLAKFKYSDIGVKDLPRWPVFIGIRCEDDL